MANPQLENGFIRIAHELAEALMQTSFTSYQQRFLWVLWAKTYGFQKKADWISNSQFSQLTGIRPQHIARAKAELLARNVITNRGNKLAFNKDYTAWRELPIGVKRHDLPIGVTKVTNRGKNRYQSGLQHKKRNKKEKKKKKKEKKVEVKIPDWMDRELWNDFLDHRKKIKKPMTDNAQNRMFVKLQKFKEQKYDVEEIINNSIINGWTGVFLPKEDKARDAKRRFLERV